MAHLFSVGDLDRSFVFYHQLLQLDARFEDQPDGSRQLLLGQGDEQLRLVTRSWLRQKHPLLFTALDRAPAGLGVLLRFTIAKLPRVARRLEEEGVHLVYEVEDAEHRRRELWLYDPDHYLVALHGPL